MSEKKFNVIKHLKDNLRFSGEEIGRRLGVSASYISNLYNGKPIGKVVSIKIAEEFKLPIYFVLTGNNFEENNLSSNLYLTNQNVTKIPYYNVEATAGKLNVFNDNNETPDYLISIPAFSDCDFAVNVAGHSMYPKFNNGDIIICKKINNLNIIPFGETFLVVTNEQRLVKYIKPGKSDEYISLESENEKFDPFEILKSDIIQLYLIKGKIERNQI